MNIHFNHSEPVNAPAETLFDVITDYASYPSFDAALIKIEVVTKDENGAEFLADRKTRIGQQLRAFDRTSARAISSSSGAMTATSQRALHGPSIRWTTPIARSPSMPRKAST